MSTATRAQLQTLRALDVPFDLDSPPTFEEAARLLRESTSPGVPLSSIRPEDLSSSVVTRPTQTEWGPMPVISQALDVDAEIASLAPALKDHPARVSRFLSLVQQMLAAGSGIEASRIAREIAVQAEDVAIEIVAYRRLAFDVAARMPPPAITVAPMRPIAIESVIDIGAPSPIRPTEEAIRCTSAPGPAVHIATPHIATLPDGTRINIPAGTVLRPPTPRDALLDQLRAARRRLTDAGDRRDGDACDEAEAEVEQIERLLAAPSEVTPPPATR